MKAIVYTRYGPPEVLGIKEIEKPIPKKNEVLIKVYATTVTAGDWRMRKPDPLLARLVNGLFRPQRVKVLGMELAGKIEAVGKDVTRYKIGDEIFAASGFGMGAYAEYKCLSENGKLAIKPPNISYEEAAAIPIGANTALYYLRDKAKIKRNQKVLIYGASGSVGTYAVQLGKYFGAEVTGVCSTSNLKMIKSIGADHVIDYATTDFIKREKYYDIIFDAVGKTSFQNCKSLLLEKGKYVTVNKGLARGNAKNFELLRKLVEAKIIKVVIDKCYPMTEIVQAHRYVEQGHKKGNVIVTIAGEIT